MAVQQQHTAVVDALILAGANVDLAEHVRTVHSMKYVISFPQPVHVQIVLILGHNCLVKSEIHKLQ